MANESDLERALQGKEAWNEWVTKGRQAAAGVPKADFSGATFEAVDFKGFQFLGVADFSNCRFACDADFHGAIFHSAAHFTGAQFLKSGAFASCAFNAQTSFTNAHFHSDAWFTHAEFSSQAWFQNALFDADFEATDAVFKSDARFVDVRFFGRAWFHDATFERGAWFNAAQFRKDARFTRTRFEGGAEEFSDARFAMAPDFRAARFQVPPTFQRSAFEYSTDGAASHWRRLLKCAFDNSQAPSYRRLKQIASETKDHERELQFFALELRAKRFYETTAFWPLALNISYGWFSDYGRSIARPLAWWAAIAVLSTLVVLGLAPGSATSVLDRVGAALVVGITNSGLLIGADKWLLRLEAVERLCTTCQGRFGLLADSLFYLQSALSLLFVFLVGLALRNRFRIGGTG